MRGMAVLLAALTAASAIWAIIAAYGMGAWLSRHGVKVNWFLYRATMLWHVAQYRTMTTVRDGRPGSLYLQFLVAINLALVLALVSIVLQVAGRR